MYAKIAKWTSWVLIIISVVILIWGAATGFESNSGIAVDIMLRWGYILLIAAIALVVILGIVLTALNNPKGLLKTGLGLLVVAVIALIAYATASGSPLVAYIGEQPDHSTLKLTDTLLNLTYLLGGCAIVSIILGEVISTVRK